MRSSWPIGILMAVTILLTGCREEPKSNRPMAALQAVEVTVSKARLVPVANQIEVVGTVASRYTAEIASKISGSINALPVHLGSEVERGDLLLEMSAGEIDARLVQAVARLQQARRNLSREKTLLAKNAATPETVKSLEESLAFAEAAHQEARILQSYTRITAPIPGRVTRKLANIGDLATPGKLLLAIEDQTQLQVVTDIPEAMLPQVGIGDTLEVHVPSARLAINGTVAEVSPTANPTTRSGLVKLDIVGHQDLRPGQFARVVLSEKGIKTLTVPRQALVTRGQIEQLFVVQADTARLRLVRSGTMYGTDIEILSGLEPGESVVLTGQQHLQDGQPVVVQ